MISKSEICRTGVQAGDIVRIDFSKSIGIVISVSRNNQDLAFEDQKDNKLIIPDYQGKNGAKLFIRLVAYISGLQAREVQTDVLDSFFYRLEEGAQIVVK